MTTGRINQISIIHNHKYLHTYFCTIYYSHQAVPSTAETTEENLCAFLRKFLPSRLSQPGFTTFRGRLCRELLLTLSTDKPSNSYKGTMSTVSRAKAQRHQVIHPTETIEMIPVGSLYNLKVLHSNGFGPSFPTRRFRSIQPSSLLTQYTNISSFKPNQDNLSRPSPRKNH